MREITIVLPHYMNRGMLLEQQRVWADYPADLRSRVHVVVVDDCSPKGQSPTPEDVTIKGLASFRIYRLKEKKRWNWLACRNLGAKLATTEWILLTDIDHAVPAETLRRILDGPLDPDCAYKFKRIDAPRPWPYDLSQCAIHKVHNDSWLQTRALFFDPRVGGYDETLSGLYGTSGEYRDRLAVAARAHVILNEKLIRYPREVIADASTSPDVYTRKGDPDNDEELKRRKAIRAKDPNWKPKHGLVPYELIYSSQVLSEAAAIA